MLELTFTLETANYDTTQLSEWVARLPTGLKVGTIRRDCGLMPDNDGHDVHIAGWRAHPYQLEAYEYKTRIWRTLDSAKADCVAFAYEALARGKA